VLSEFKQWTAVRTNCDWIQIWSDICAVAGWPLVFKAKAIVTTKRRYLSTAPVHSNVWHSNNFVMAHKICTGYPIQNYCCELRMYAMALCVKIYLLFAAEAEAGSNYNNCHHHGAQQIQVHLKQQTLHYISLFHKEQYVWISVPKVQTSLSLL